MSRADRRAMMDPDHKDLSVVQQCELLGLSRSSFYSQPVKDNAADLELMALIDRQFLETPTYGSRRMVAVLRRAGHVVNRKRVRQLMRQMVVSSNHSSVLFQTRTPRTRMGARPLGPFRGGKSSSSRQATQTTASPVLVRMVDAPMARAARSAVSEAPP